MQISTDFNALDALKRQPVLFFWLSALFSLSVFLFSVYLHIPQLAFFPFAIIFLLLTLLNFNWIFYLMLFVMPLSIEYTFGSLGLDLPSEPIVMLLCACGIFYIVYRLPTLDTSVFRNSIVTLLLIQFLWSVFATFYSFNIFLSLKYLLAKTWYIVTFFFLPIFFITAIKSIKRFFWCLFIPTFIGVIIVLIRHAFLGFTFDTITHCVLPIFRNHVNYAVFITMLFPLIPMAIQWYDKKSFYNKLLKLSIPIFIAAIYFSYTRGAWLAFLAMGVYYLVIVFKHTKTVLLGAGLIVSIFLVYILHDNTYLKYSPNFEHTIYHDELGDHLASTLEMEDMSTVERFYRWIAAVHLFKQHPIVGVGPNGFVSQYKKYTVTAFETYISDNEEKSTVHNYFLLLLTEQGIPAVLIFCSFIVAILLSAEKTYHRINPEYKKYVMAFTLCVVVFLINNSLSDLVEANKVGSLFYMSAAILVNLTTLANQQEKARKSLP